MTYYTKAKEDIIEYDSDRVRDLIHNLKLDDPTEKEIYYSHCI